MTYRKIFQEVKRMSQLREVVEKILREVFPSIEISEEKLDEITEKFTAGYLKVIAGEFDRFLKESVNTASKRDLARGAGRVLGDVTVILDWKKPIGAYLSFGVANKLPKETELSKLLKVLNLKFFDGYQCFLFKSFLKEEHTNDVRTKIRTTNPERVNCGA
jgi:hypothetical protein